MVTSSGEYIKCCRSADIKQIRKQHILQNKYKAELGFLRNEVEKSDLAGDEARERKRHFFLPQSHRIPHPGHRTRSSVILDILQHLSYFIALCDDHMTHSVSFYPFLNVLQPFCHPTNNPGDSRIGGEIICADHLI